MPNTRMCDVMFPACCVSVNCAAAILMPPALRRETNYAKTVDVLMKPTPWFLVAAEACSSLQLNHYGGILSIVKCKLARRLECLEFKSESRTRMSEGRVLSYIQLFVVTKTGSDGGEILDHLISQAKAAFLWSNRGLRTKMDAASVLKNQTNC